MSQDSIREGAIGTYFYIRAKLDFDSSTLKVTFDSPPTPGQNGHHFANIFTCIFKDEKFFFISMQMSNKFVTKGLIDNIPALVQIMAWRGTGDKPLFEQMLAYVAGLNAF